MKKLMLVFVIGFAALFVGCAKSSSDMNDKAMMKKEMSMEKDKMKDDVMMKKKMMHDDAMMKKDEMKKKMMKKDSM